MSYTVVVTSAAKQDLRNAYLWAAERAPHTAALWLDRFEAELQTLADSPQRFQLAPENASVEPEIRQLIFGRRLGLIAPYIRSSETKFKFCTSAELHGNGPVQTI